MSGGARLWAFVAGPDPAGAAAQLEAVGCEAWFGRGPAPVWVDRADLVVRLPGESADADAAVARAYQRGVPVFHVLNSALLYAEAASVPFLNAKAGAA